MQINSLAAVEIPPGTHRLSDGKLMQKLDELKEEFSELMRELRRRKSLADGIIVNSQVSTVNKHGLYLTRFYWK